VACLSGRIGFELVQKAVMAGLGGIVAVGAPTSLAVALAEEHDLLMCGFVRDGSFNVYVGADRLAVE
jgi:FdhD protein